MFDLPTLTAKDLKAYRQFRKFLVKDGFFMMQESIYSKIALNANAAHLIIDKIKTNKPPAGNVSILTVTEKQYNNMELIVGELNNTDITSNERILIL